MSVLAVAPLFDTNQIRDDLAHDISDRRSQELVFAFIGPVGSGVSTAAGIFETVLTSEFGYTVCPIIKPSEIIKSEAFRVGVKIDSKEELAKYINSMQDAGNNLREIFDENYLAEKVVEKIAKFRTQNNGTRQVGDRSIIMPGRRAYIIDSIKNRGELNLLKEIYGETLCVIGVFAPDEVRRQRLINGSVSEAAVDAVVSRDKAELPTFGQMTQKIFVEADFFICNDELIIHLQQKINRYLNILFDRQIHTPLRAESAMYKANSASLNSACMSRRVGAAIVSAAGELISVGWNDVPKFKGGLYSEDDRSAPDNTGHHHNGDHRCFNWGLKICHNETRRNSIMERMIKRVQDAKFIKKNTLKDEIAEVLSDPSIESIIEYSRSIHAEMEAILAVAREGKHSIVGATLYTTTYPCHNCARHIVASGIISVVYIEPYAKSLAIALHGDAVVESRKSGTHVTFRQYDGVAPRVFLKMFNPLSSRKDNGKAAPKDPKLALPIFRISLDGHGDYEAKVIADLTEKEQNRPKR